MNWDRIIGWIIAIILLVGGGYFLINKSVPEQNNDSINLGVILPLSSGSGVDQGEWIKHGMDLALEEINQKSNRKLNLIYEDSKGETKTAVLAYNSLRARYNVPVVFTWGSSIGLALTSLANRDKVVHMGVATAVPDYATPNDFTFRNFPSTVQESEYLAKVISEDLKVKKVAIIKINNDYGIGGTKSFKEQYTSRGGRVLMEETIEPNNTDFRSQLTKIKNLNPSFVYISSYPKEGGLLIKQARELSITSQFIASFAIIGGKEFLDLAGSNANGLLLPTAVPTLPKDQGENFKKFVEAYKNKYNEDPGIQQHYSIRAYDSLKIIYDVIVKCGSSNTECIKNSLFDIKDYQGAGGIVSFDNNGDVPVNFDLVVIKDGEFVRFK